MHMVSYKIPNNNYKLINLNVNFPICTLSQKTENCLFMLFLKLCMFTQFKSEKWYLYIRVYYTRISQQNLSIIFKSASIIFQYSIIQNKQDLHLCIIIHDIFKTTFFLHSIIRYKNGKNCPL